jgi:integrase
MPLTALSVQRAASTDKPFKLSDQGGLYLLVTVTGSKLWRMNYRFAGRYKTLALGSYPVVTLADARSARDNAKKSLASGVDPSAQKRVRRVSATIAADNSFQAVAESYLEKRKGDVLTESVRVKDAHLLRKAYVGFGQVPIAEVRPADVLAVIRRIEAKGHAAQRFKGTVGRVFRYAIAMGLCDVDPSAALGDAMVKRRTVAHPSPKTPKAIGAMLRAIDDYDGQETTRLAMLVAAHTFVRPKELHRAEWTEIDLGKQTWRIPAAKMKMDRDHIVPLSTQATSFFGSLQRLTGGGRWVFPSIYGENYTISHSTINAALRRMGYSGEQMVGHGFRGMASTILNESGQFAPDWVERQLAHVEGNAARRAYNAALHLTGRTEMMQWYSDWLDEQKADKA